MSNCEEAVSATVDAQPPPAELTYCVSTWDHEIESWQTRASSAAKWELRRWLRTLYAESWDRVSILIERNV